MNRRVFIQAIIGSSLLSSLPAHALLLQGSGDMIMAIFPGTAAAEVDMRLFRDYTSPMTTAISNSIHQKVYAEAYRSFPLIKNVIEAHRADMLFIPPTLVVRAMEQDYQPIVRVKDFLSGVVIKRKGVAVNKIAMTGPDSWPGVMGRYVIKQHKLGPTTIIETVKNQEAVVFLMEQKVAQAGVLSTKKAEAMIATGQYEIWYPLTSTPGFTLMLHNKLMAKYGEPISQTMLSLSTPAIDGLQTLIPAMIKQFVPCGKQDYEMLKQILETA